jgi:hypothetical protein
MGNNRIFVYTEDAPVHGNVVARGLSRAAPPILRSISDYIEGIAIFSAGRWFTKSDLDPDLEAMCTTLPRLPTILSKLLRRFRPFGDRVADAMPARLLAPVLRSSNANALFCFIGSDIGTLMRATDLANRASKPYIHYLVDDFLLPLRLAGKGETAIRTAAQRAAVALRGATHVFTITDGLGDYLRETFGVSSTTLNLAFEPDTRPSVSVKNQIIYVGSVNFLYANGLRDLFHVVERIRRDTQVDLTVRLTVPARIAVAELGELPQFAVCEPIATAQGLAREIASSLFAFLPYSFDLRERAMVTTSFPSKAMEYLAYARSIVVHGPEYGVATKLFRKMALPSLVSSPGELEGVTRSHMIARPEHSVIYRTYLVEAHSLAATRKTICNDLGIGTD